MPYRFSRPLSTIAESGLVKFQPLKKKFKDFVNETDLFSVGQFGVVVLGVVWSSGRLVGQFENLSKKVDSLDSDMKAMIKEMRDNTKEMREMMKANAKEIRIKMEQDKCELIKKIDSKRGAFFW